MKKKLVSALLSLCLVLALQPGTAQADFWGDLLQPKTTYEVTGGKIYFNLATGELYNADQSVTEALIPSSIEGVAVTSIGDSAFAECFYVTNVTIPDGVTSIGSNAFLHCDELAHVTIPDSVTSIGGGAFQQCYSLESVTLPPNLKSIEDYAFYGCWLLEAVVIPDGVTTIGYRSFSGCFCLKTIYIPNSVTSIGMEAFSDTISDIYYSGTTDQWMAISIPPITVSSLLNAKFHSNYSVTPQEEKNPLTATPTTSTVLVNGAQTSFDAYNIGGANFFKLRDLAYVLNGTAKQFEVSWDGAANCIALTSGAAYTAVGGEMASQGGGEQTAAPTTSQILKDGKEVSLTAYNINGANYFKLRDIGEAFDFGVDWDQATQTISISTSKGYTAG